MRKRKIEAMHEAYGTSPNLCKDCTHFVTYITRSGRNIFKCEAYGESCAESTDWRKSFMACGLFGKPLPEQFSPMIERLKHAARKELEGPVEGQIEMEDLL